jgi:DNA-binding transcriptional LysR family regulator
MREGMKMNRYQAVVKIVDTGGFTKAAEELGYTQSAVSQMVQSLENELGTVLFTRSKKGISLTPDGEELLPYIKNIYHAYRELLEKQREMRGLEKGIIRIGTFASVSCHWLPGLMKEFKEKYPTVHFELYQGDYNTVEELIREGSVDFGFINPEAVPDMKTIPLKEDPMLAVLPPGHPLASGGKVSLQALAEEPFILLEEGRISEPLDFFRKHGLTPNIQYRVHDDYTIMSMVEKELGVAILPELILNRLNYKIAIKEIEPGLSRTIAVAFKEKKTLPIASRYFIEYITAYFERESAL